MNDQPILDAVSDELHEIVDATTPGLLSRRAAVKRTAGLSAGTVAALALGSVPVALAALSREAGAQAASASSVRSVLEFAFLLENLESEFYKAVLGTSASAAVNTAFNTVRAQINALAEPTRTAVLNTFTLISQHEVAHVNFLRTALNTGGTAPTYTAASFDFTGARGAGNGPFARATSDLPFLLAATQAFEDTGVRAYKGQAGNLLGTATLTAALGIHAVEARHAARVRRIRRALNPTDTVLRLSGTIRGTGRAALGGTVTPAPSEAVLAGFDAIYGGATPEGNITQGGIDLTPIAAVLGTNATTAAQEAFDEPLRRDEVVAIVQPFVVATVS